MVMKIGYFCTAGYTETGGIKQLLEKINPNVRWERCFPAVDKPYLARGRMNSTPIASHNGVTGGELVRMMHERLSRYYKNSDYDGFLLIDDLDCRFPSNLAEGINLFVENQTAEVQVSLGKPVNFYVLFASPEIEAWFIADWNNSFAKQYPGTIAFNLKQIISNYLLKDYWDNNLELYGGNFVNNSCESKISSEIQDIFSEVGVDADGNAYSYSKRIEGVDMLRRIEPERVSIKCNICFAPLFHRLHELR